MTDFTEAQRRLAVTATNALDKLIYDLPDSLIKNEVSYWSERLAKVFGLFESRCSDDRK